MKAKTRTNQPVEFENYDLPEGAKILGDVPFEQIKDAQGHLRFIEGAITAPEMENIEILYSKWSLSGTHLMMVIAGRTTEANTVFTNASFSISNLPQWIFDKIVPIYRTSYIDRGQFLASADEDLTTTTLSLNMQKSASYLTIASFSPTTIAKISGFRIVFDLLIDNEEPEGE